ncbi:recombination regulator RecX [Moraxella sp. FZLJ2107]|uniref:regulatory protein RecX n=1 Tax=unclassified Moraxella TaxID=2685852 RepID=UPI0020C84E68|nr:MULTISPECIES: regulatory protein RecX [unclassified Moraxella]UTO04879.1 recombination regulator RecX [Moraxella sp. FZLJ2107]UTO21613.1 recombination regulator RecX [Moraxella sp. FZLJ2109]
MTIKTLSEILAEMGESPVSAESYQPTVLDASNFYTLTTTKPAYQQKQNLRPKKSISTAKRTTPKPASTKHQAKSDDVYDNHQTQLKTQADTLSDGQAIYDKKPISNSQADTDKSTPKTRQSRNRHHNQHHDDTPKITALLNDAKLGQTNAIITDKLAAALADVAIEPIATTDRATNYMRWLAFYYLSHRELSRHELRQKLLAKDCDPIAVDALIEEFADKGYQSDERCAYMLIRENIRKGRGKIHIREALKSAKINLPYTLDELINNADIDSLTDGTALADHESDEVDWLRLAVEARTRKYGYDLPTTPKDKAKQLRFLQYRGFETGVCLDALRYTPDMLDELDSV